MNPNEMSLHELQYKDLLTTDLSSRSYAIQNKQGNIKQLFQYNRTLERAKQIITQCSKVLQKQLREYKEKSEQYQRELLTQKQQIETLNQELMQEKKQNSQSQLLLQEIKVVEQEQIYFEQQKIIKIKQLEDKKNNYSSQLEDTRNQLKQETQAKDNEFKNNQRQIEFLNKQIFNLEQDQVKYDNQIKDLIQLKDKLEESCLQQR